MMHQPSLPACDDRRCNSAGRWRKNLVATGWITDDDLDAFGDAVNHPDVSGTAARHAHRANPPRYPTDDARRSSAAHPRSHPQVAGIAALSTSVRCSLMLE
jgi:hypothetical protein